MAHGALLGQTPILNAEGIEYNNSTTSEVITANNIQQAIDESVKKIESVENNGLSWELIYTNSHKGNYVSNSSSYKQPIITGILSEKDANNYFMLILKTTSTLVSSDGTGDDFFGLVLSSETYDKNRAIRLGVLNGSGTTTSQYLIPLCYNGGTINESNYYYTAYSSTYTSFAFGDSLFVTADATNRHISVNINIQIYGLKAPI